MVKVKKFLSLVITIFLILSNFAFAQKDTPTFTCADSDNGKNEFVEGIVDVGDDLRQSYSSYRDKCVHKLEETNAQHYVKDKGILYDVGCRDNNCYVAEFYCDGTNLGNTVFECPNGCQEGTCLKIAERSEQAACSFKGSDSEQKCYSDNGKFGCRGKESCIMKVSGSNGEKITWKSSCGGYAYTEIDGDDETVTFDCANKDIVNPSGKDSAEEQMKERFARGDLSEEEMKRMAKAKSGSSFDEMEFKRGMIELKDRMERKDTFSYENEGYGQGYDAGPSYEGYSKEQMIFGMVFEHIGDDIDPREIKQNCNEPEKITDMVIGKLREKIGDFQKLCSRMEYEEAKCAETTKKSCSQLGSAMVREDASETEKINSLAYSCPVNKDALVEACKKRNLQQIEQRIKNADETCRKRFDFEGERLTKECEKFRENTICGKEKFIEKCMGGIKKEDFGGNRDSEQKIGFMYAKWECYDGAGESHTDSSCKSSEVWNELARKYCEGHCYADKSKCGVNRVSVSGECGKVTKPICPAYPTPQCSEGTALKTKTDSNGCAYYYCETIAVSPCPPVSTPQCAEGATLLKKIDEKGCGYYYCETSAAVCAADAQQCPDGSYVARDPANNCNFKPCPTRTCPEPIMPTCASGTTLEKKTDEKNCVYYYCKTMPCPEVSKQVCAEGQSMTTKHDDKGCITGYECVSITTTSNQSIQSSVTGYAVLSTYDDYLRHCGNSWIEQQKICSNTPSVCDKDAFIEKCKEQEKRNYGDFTLKIAKNCEIQTQSEIMHVGQRCAKIDEERSHCLEQNAKRCEQMKGTAEKCKETLTEENIRKFILEEAKKRCKFTDIIEHEDDIKKAEKAEIVLAVLSAATQDDLDKLELFVDGLKEELKLQDTTVYKGTINPNNFGDIKLLPFVVNAKLSSAASSERAKEVKARIVAGQNAEETAGKLASLRDSDVPAEYLYIIEDKASDVLDVSENLDDIEKKEDEKGFGYKVRRFLGLAKKAEESEIKQLGESNEKLKGSIDALAKLADEVPSDVAKAILKEQVESLKKQQTDIEVLIKTKEKKAKGLLGIFG